MKIPLITVAGPTASGKSDLAIRLALRHNGEIISADSMQIYKGLDIASAKPTKAEMEGIPHHLLDFLPLEESFSVVQYTSLAKDKIFDIYKRGKTPILAGGTGLYIDSLLQNIDFGSMPDTSDIEKNLKKRMEEEGAEALHAELLSLDPQAAEKLHPNNKGRVLRALTVYQATGKTMSERLADSRKNPSPFAPLFIGISYRDRAKLYERINIRVDKMLEEGLLDEVKNIMEKHGKTSIQAIGHKELQPYIKGEKSLESAVETLKQETRRYAKRQLTWFRKNPAMHWFYKDDFNSIEDFNEAVHSLVRKEGFDVQEK